MYIFVFLEPGQFLSENNYFLQLTQKLRNKYFRIFIFKRFLEEIRLQLKINSILLFHWCFLQEKPKNTFAF